MISFDSLWDNKPWFRPLCEACFRVLLLFHPELNT